MWGLQTWILVIEAEACLISIGIVTLWLMFGGLDSLEKTVRNALKTKNQKQLEEEAQRTWYDEYY